MLRGPKYKICKRVGGMVFPQCQSPRYNASLNKEGKGKGRPKPRSEYGVQFLEKQKAKFTYGMTERQFANYVGSSQKTKGSNPAIILNQNLETRLDNLIYRLGIAVSRTFARQIVSHGHILVNGRKNNIPSYSVKIGDKISIRKQSSDNAIFRDLANKMKGVKIPKWVKFDTEKMAAEIVSLPELSDGDQTLNLNTVIEFYSRT